MLEINGEIKTKFGILKWVQYGEGLALILNDKVIALKDGDKVLQIGDKIRADLGNGGRGELVEIVGFENIVAVHTSEIIFVDSIDRVARPIKLESILLVN